MTATRELPRRALGTTGLMVTPVCLGCAPLGDMPETFAYSVPEDRALATIRAAFDGPINFIDTAASYGDGESERRIGVVIKELGGVPEGVVLATKADRDLKTGEFTGDQMRRSVERSLRLLGLDRLQLVYLHDPEHADFDELNAPGGAVEALVRLKEEGIIEHLGVAPGPIDLTIRYVETGAYEVAITHNRYTLVNRSAEPLLRVCAERGVAVANAAPYGSGMLAKGPEEYPRYAYQEASPALVEKVRRLAAACERHGVPLAAAALQFSIRDPRIGTTIVGMTRPERLAQTAALATTPIPEALWPELEEIADPQGDDPETNRWKK
jgi:D-threo-aldose 1-dehydrogenase